MHARPRVDPGTDLQTQAAHLAYDRASTADAAGRPVEGRQEAVAGGINLTTAEPGELLTDDGVVAVEQIPPPPVAQRDCPLRGANDVSEHDRGQDPIRLLAAAGTGEELLDLLEEGLGVADPREMVGAGQLHVLCPLNAFGDVSSGRHANDAIALTVHDE